MTVKLVLGISPVLLLSTLRLHAWRKMVQTWKLILIDCALPGNKLESQQIYNAECSFRTVLERLLLSWVSQVTKEAFITSKMDQCKPSYCLHLTKCDNCCTLPSSFKLLFKHVIKFMFIYWVFRESSRGKGKTK